MPTDSDPVRLERGSARRVFAATRAVERESIDLTGESGRRDDRRKETILARVTDVAAPFISWEEVYLEDDGETWQPKDPARIGTHDGDSPGVVLPGVTVAVDQIVVLKRCPLSDGADPPVWVPGWLAIAGGTSGTFAVQVEKTGGANGTKTAAASWVYTVKDLDGNTLGTSVVLTHPRPFGTATFQAGSSGYGVAFYDAAGALKLWDAGEIYGVGSCP